jgi:hypothetical protein
MDKLIILHVDVGTKLILDHLVYIEHVRKQVQLEEVEGYNVQTITTNNPNSAEIKINCIYPPAISFVDAEKLTDLRSKLDEYVNIIQKELK